jgi:GR25 family glycosyltransferase involved in LPS biosynthesis
LADSFNFFDGILYINLDHRKDRKKRILRELERLHVPRPKIHRIAGCYDPLNGHRGCVESHRKALAFASQKKWKTVLILEDDCVFGARSAVEKAVQALKRLNNDWDAFLFGGKFFLLEECQAPGLARVFDAQNAHAYAVQSDYIPILDQCYKEACEGMKQILFFFETREWALDIRWKLLQRKNRWYTPKKPVAFQGPSFSDIRQRQLPKR